VLDTPDHPPSISYGEIAASLVSSVISLSRLCFIIQQSRLHPMMDPEIQLS